MCAGKVALNVQLIRKSGDTGFSQVPSIGESDLGGSTMYVVSKESSNINMLSHGWSYNFGQCDWFAISTCSLMDGPTISDDVIGLQPDPPVLDYPGCHAS